MFNKVKKYFNALVKGEFVSIHWDKKLIQEGRGFTAFERSAVLLSHRNGTKWLGFTSTKRNWKKSL